MWNFIKKIKDFFKFNSINLEEIQKELYFKLKNDKSLLNNQFNILYNIIHCGAYSYIHGDCKQYKKYWKEGNQFIEIIRNNKQLLNNIVALYEKFKDKIL